MGMSHSAAAGCPCVTWPRQMLLAAGIPILWRLGRFLLKGKEPQPGQVKAKSKQ